MNINKIKQIHQVSPVYGKISFKAVQSNLLSPVIFISINKTGFYLSSIILLEKYKHGLVCHLKYRK